MWIACGLAYGMTRLLTPMSMRIATKIGAVDVPRDWRRMHSRAVPRAGGIGILLGVLIAWAALGDGAGENGWITAGYVGFFAIGLVDDVLCLGARSKLMWQTGIALLSLWGSGARGAFLLLGCVWVLTLVNSHNMIDGLDGLLVGSVILEGSALSVVLLLSGLPGGGLSVITVLACLGFLPFNRYPAKTFSGDCGSESLGFLMGMLSLPLLQNLSFEIGALTPLFLFAYPLTDLTAAVLRRLLRGKSPFSADRGHLHHRIFDAGVDHARCTVILLTLVGAMGSIGVLLCRPDLWEGAAVACLVSVGIMIRLRGYILNFS